jgi:ubiquinone/menaquinone biosynthesis C-methylase UbiE
MAEPEHEEYADDESAQLQLIWGDGFLSPGGAEEVGRILGGHSIEGAKVLDIGSGQGGADIVLALDHGAAKVLGVDVTEFLVKSAALRAETAGVSDRVEFRVIAPGPLPFDDASFDVVFSKDAILHIQDKDAFYREAFRVLRPGGRLLVGDWLRGHGDELTPLADAFNEAAGGTFTMVSAEETAASVARAGFTDVETDDRSEWYAQEAAAELAELRDGVIGQEFRDRWGDPAGVLSFWETLIASLRNGGLKPTHVRAVKPPA